MFLNLHFSKFRDDDDLFTYACLSVGTAQNLEENEWSNHVGKPKN